MRCLWFIKETSNSLKILFKRESTLNVNVHLTLKESTFTIGKVCQNTTNNKVGFVVLKQNKSAETEKERKQG